MAGQGAELRREIRPEGESGSGGRVEKTLGIGSGWARQGHFLTDATLALELIHMGESQGKEGVRTSELPWWATGAPSH